MTHLALGIAARFVAAIVGAVPAFAFLMAAEVLLSRPGATPSWASRVKSGVFWVVYLLISAALMSLIDPALASLGVKPLIPSLTPALRPAWVGEVLGVIFALLVADFFYYWFHRFQHRFLWRLHAVHHSVREMSAVTGYHHFTELPIKALLYGLPISLLTRDPLSIPVVSAIMTYHGHYLHSVTRLNFGWFGRIIQDNRFHRIHHSVHPEHFDKNFGVTTPLWDVLFRTSCFPKPGEWVEVGVAGEPEIHTISDFLWRPFRASKERVALTVEKR